MVIPALIPDRGTQYFAFGGKKVHWAFSFFRLTHLKWTE